MPERTTITQITQVGVETTPGTGVAANKLLQALSIEPAIKADIKTFRPLGAKYTTIAALGKEWVEAKISGDVACYNHLAYLFSSIMAYQAPVQQGGSAAYLWTFTPAQSAEDTVKTFTVEQGSSARAGKFTYGIVTDLGLKFSREAISVDGTMLGQAYQDGITLTSSPTAIPIQPILPTALDVFIDSTSAGIGSTKLTRAFSGSFSFGNRFGPLWALNSAVSGFAATVELVPKAQLKLLVEADAAGMGPLTAMRAGDKRYIRLKVVGPLIASTYYYTFQMDLAAVVSDVSDFSDQDGVYAIEWTFDVAFDAAWSSGRAMQVQLTNVLTTL